MWRRRSCQCKHLRLITHEKILLNGDVARRNGNVTYSVNRPKEPNISSPIKIFSAFCETRNYLTVFKRTCYLSLSILRQIYPFHSMPSYFFRIQCNIPPPPYKRKYSKRYISFSFSNLNLACTSIPRCMLQ